MDQHLPTIYKHKCFNPLNLSFNKEVEDTEIGHLFEHIILEYLYKYKTENSKSKVIFKGKTFWNWKKDQFGTFYITINNNLEDIELFKKALNNAILLTNQILHS